MSKNEGATEQRQSLAPAEAGLKQPVGKSDLKAAAVVVAVGLAAAVWWSTRSTAPSAPQRSGGYSALLGTEIPSAQPFGDTGRAERATQALRGLAPEFGYNCGEAESFVLTDAAAAFLALKDFMERQGYSRENLATPQGAAVWHATGPNDLMGISTFVTSEGGSLVICKT